MNRSLKQLLVRQLDQKTLPWRELDSSTAPSAGWLKTIRRTLGMSTSQLASRVNVTRQAIADQERREVAGTITLRALRRAADAMDCDLVYAIVPRRPVSEMLRTRARAIAEEILTGVAHSMRLEEQSVSQDEFDRQVSDLADQILRDLPRNLWDESAA